MLGLIDPDEGTLLYRGQEVDSLRGRVGYMMQKDLLFPWRTVLDNVLLGRDQGIDPKLAMDTARRVHQRIRPLGFENAARKCCRVANDNAQLLDPHWCSTPTFCYSTSRVSLSTTGTAALYLGVLMEAVGTFCKTVILVATHDIDEAVALSKRVIVLSPAPLPRGRSNT